MIKEDDYQKYYEIKEKIGRGGFANVYRGINIKTDEERAIKVIDIDIYKEEHMKVIYNEINNMKICSENNENSVKIYECYRYKDNLRNEFVIIMELCDNNLQKILDEKNEGFTCEQIKEIMTQLNHTFRIMYNNKIIHRDIKLDNIVVKTNKDDSNIFIPKLTDYGISKQLKNTMGKTNIGTYLTMAPEIMEGKFYDYKCDLWSIGIIIYQLYFKEYPYTGETQIAINNMIKRKGNKLLKKTNNNNLDNLINKLLTIEPEKRISYQEYFNHPFFNSNNDNRDDSKEFSKKGENMFIVDFTLENIEKALNEYMYSDEPGAIKALAEDIYKNLNK